MNTISYLSSCKHRGFVGHTRGLVSLDGTVFFEELITAVAPLEHTKQGWDHERGEQAGDTQASNWIFLIALTFWRFLPFSWIDAVIRLQYVEQLLVMFCHPSGPLEKCLGGHGIELGRIGRAIMVHQ